MSGYLPDLEIKTATSIDEAVALSNNGNSVFLSGGTDLIPNLRRGIGEPQLLVNLSGIAEMNEITETENGLRIGAAVTLQHLINDSSIQENFPLLSEAAETIAGTTHRFSATVGGNLCQDTRCKFYNQSDWWRSSLDYCLKYKGDICHVAPKGKVCRAAYSGDLAPALLLHDAEVELRSPTGKRTIKLQDMYQEDGADNMLLESGELVVAVTVTKLKDYKVIYHKTRVRGGVDFPLAGIALATLTNNGQLEDIRIALTGTNSRPVLIENTATLTGKIMDDVGLKALKKLILTQIMPMRSTFTPSSYRRKVVERVALKLVKQQLGI